MKKQKVTSQINLERLAGGAFAEKLNEAQDVTYLCTECAIKAGFLSDYPRNRRKPGGNREQRRRAKRNARR